MDKKNHILWMDGLRGIGAVQVMLLHLIEQTSWHPHGLFSLLNDGALAVALFFCISGSVLTKWVGKSSDDFLVLTASRAARLFIPSAAAVIFSFLMWLVFRVSCPQPYADIPLDANIYSVFINSVKDIFVYVPIIGHRDSSLFLNVPVLGDHARAHHMMLSVLWTMSLEFYGSILIIAMAFAAKKNRQSALKYVIPLVGLLTFKSMLFPFVFGCYLAYVNFSNEDEKNYFLPFVLVVIASFFTIDATNGHYYEWAEYIASLPNIVPAQSSYSVQKGFAAMLIFFAIIKSGDLRALLSSRAAMFLGKISFPLYLCHGPLLLMVQFLKAWVLGEGGGVLGAEIFSIGIYALCLFPVVAVFLKIDAYAVYVSHKIRSLRMNIVH